jgi:hypothetical protein
VSVDAPVTGWCTNWSAYNTPRLWAMVAEEDDPEAWRQVAALSSLAGTVDDQRSRLIRARDALAEAWPPEKNAAAQAFITQINILLRNMDNTRSAADRSAQALGSVLDALRKAKNSIQPLYQQYLDKSDDLVPGWWDHAEDELDDKARGHMMAAERQVEDHGRDITPPAKYQLGATAETGAGKKGFSDGGAGDPSAGNANSSNSFPVPHEPPPPLPGHHAIVPVGSHTTSPAGPGLAGVIQSPPPAIPPGLPVAGPMPAAPSIPPSAIGGFLPVGMGGPSLRPVGGGASFGRGMPKGLPSGSVIGQTPLGRPAGTPAKPTPPSWLPSGQGQPGSRDRGSRALSGAPVASGRGRHGHGREDGIYFDPDDPWATAEGVDPVIEPSRRVHRHDPGPGVIGRHE